MQCYANYATNILKMVRKDEVRKRKRTIGHGKKNKKKTTNDNYIIGGGL